MAVHLSDLNIQISSPEIILLHKENAEFLRGDRAEPSFPGLWKGWKLILKGLVIIGALGFIVLAVLLLSEWIWESPFVSEVEGIIDDMNNETVYYHYTVDGVRYDKQEPKQFYMVDFMDGIVPGRVLYLKFLPSQSKFKVNVESPDFARTIPILVFVGIFPLSFYYGLRQYNRVARLRDKATHVIEGVFLGEVAKWRGTRAYVYKAVSPVTGKNIHRSRFDNALGRIREGSTVAILYLDDKNHDLL